jgi:hypothetical protein
VKVPLELEITPETLRRYPPLEPVLDYGLLQRTIIVRVTTTAKNPKDVNLLRIKVLRSRRSNDYPPYPPHATERFRHSHNNNNNLYLYRIRHCLTELLETQVVEGVIAAAMAYCHDRAVQPVVVGILEPPIALKKEYPIARRKAARTSTTVRATAATTTVRTAVRMVPPIPTVHKN